MVSIAREPPGGLLEPLRAPNHVAGCGSDGGADGIKGTAPGWSLD